MYAATLEGSMTTPVDAVQPVELDDYQRAALLNFYAPVLFGCPPVRLDERALWCEQWATALLLREAR